MDQVGEKAKQADLPHDVRLVATVARLLDLHNSRRERGSRSTNVAQQPQVSAAAGYYLWLGLQAIQLLHRRAKEWKQRACSDRQASRRAFRNYRRHRATDWNIA